MKAVYNRCSTEAQDFDQQMQCINDYLRRINETDELVHVVEKVSGSVKHTERKLNELLKQCDKGSTIYISELSRLGRNMSDLFQIITEASEREITIVQAKDGTIIENKSIGGKALLFALSLAAEIELNNIRQRTKAGLDARKAKGLPIGGACRKNAPDMQRVQEFAAKSKKEKAASNPHNKAFAEFIEFWEVKYGTITKETNFELIADELNRRGKVTSSGMSFNKANARQMYYRICK